MTLEYILDNVFYDLVVDDVCNYHGNIEYISQHFADGITVKMSISKKQPKDIQDFIDKYLIAKETNNLLTIAQFYELFNYIN